MAEEAEDTLTVIEGIRTDAAVTAGHVAAADAVAAAGEVASEVAQVADTLEEHAELSEERHEEILGDTQWLVNTLESQSSNLQSLLSSTTALQATMTAEFSALRLSIEALRELTASRLPTQRTEPEIPTTLEIVEPAVAVAVPVAVEIPPVPPRRRRVI